MRDFFDSYLYNALCGIFDLVIINLLFVLTCLPIITIGPALTALSRVTMNMHRSEGTAVRDYFAAFRESFTGSIMCSVILALGFAIAFFDFWIIAGFWDNSVKYLLLGVAALISCLLFFSGSWVFPLLSQPHNSWLQTMKQAFLLSIGHLPRTILICILNLIPIWMFLFWSYGFLFTLAIWLLIGLSLISYINAAILRPVLDRL